MREALSNVTKHAHASTVSIEVVAEAHNVFLRVRDNGVGIDSPGEGSGLRNMNERAIAFGGGCEVTKSSAAGGTLIEWHSPLGAETAR